MLNLNDLYFFVAAVENGGFAAASRRLGVPKSTLSKRVADLEQRLDTRLIHRSSRRFVLTDLGREFHDRARAALTEAEAAEEVVRRQVAEPSGTVRITASVPVAQQQLAGHLPRLARTYPKLQLQLEVSDRFVDVVQEGFDIAVRSHFAALPDSGLVQRRLSTQAIILVASAGYLRKRKRPASVEALGSHAGLLSSAAAGTWELTGRHGQVERVSPIPSLIANESTVLVEAAIAGLGVACLPERMCRAALQARRLVRVLPHWSAGTVTTTLLMPHRRGRLPGVRAAVDFLVECLGKD